jgi:hypothetical protein
MLRMLRAWSANHFAWSPSTLSPSCASSWPFLALPAADEADEEFRAEGVDGASLGLDAMPDAAPTGTRL